MNKNDNKPACAETADAISVSMNADDLLDLKLLTSIANGDMDAFEQLYHRYQKRLFNFSYRMTGRLDVIEDIINDVMYLVWQKASTYNQKSRPSSWIIGIAYNKSLSHCRQTKQQELEIPIEDIDDSLIPGNDRWLSVLENQDWLNIAFQYLSAEQRLVLELTYWNGMHYREIAALMNCPENTVKTRMFYARKRLAVALHQEQI